jgi:beta-lactam-binding protein with PASTA domain
MELLKFLISRHFWKSLFIAIAITIVVITSIFLSLKIYTRHGQAMAVPDLTGMTLAEADSIILEKELRYQVVDSVYNTEITRGCVVEQNPPPEFKVKKNRTIFITINAFNPEMVLMPDLVGVSLRQATAIIENSGLEVGRLTYVPDIAINNVLQQKIDGNVIEEGDSIIKGSRVDLILGRGLSNDKTVAPELLGLLLEEAKDRITSRFLNLGAIIYDGSIYNAEDSAGARVWKQRPYYKETQLISLGASVDIWLTVDSLKLGLSDTTRLEIPAENEIPQ